LALDRTQVGHVATLARLALSDEEAAQLVTQLNEIFSYVEKLNELDTEGIEPTSHVLALANVFREDELRPSLPVDQVFQNAPDWENDLFQVPKIIG